MVGALANGKAGLADFPRVRGKHIHARDGTRRVSAEHRRAEQPRAQSLQPELKPAKRNISPARNSRPYYSRQRTAAPAHTNAASENRTTATGRTQSPRASRIAPQNSPARNPSSRS